jgi:hypothetical protein
MKDRGRYSYSNCGSWRENPEIEMDSTYYDYHEDLLENSKEALISIIEEAAKRDVRVVGVIFPQSPAYAETGAFGRYGLRRSRAEKLIEELQALNKKYPNFVVMDENKMGEHDYTDNMAVDEDHLCYGGAGLLSYRLNNLLLSWEQEK